MDEKQEAKSKAAFDALVEKVSAIERERMEGRGPGVQWPQEDTLLIGAETTEARLTQRLADYAERCKQVEADGMLSSEGKASTLAKLRQDAEGIGQERDDQAAKLEADIKRLAAEDEALKAAFNFSPRTPDEWAEAQARAPFCAEEIGEMAPEAIPGAVERAARAGDKIGAWLLARHGRQRLRGLRMDGVHTLGLLEQTMANLQAPDAAGVRKLQKNAARTKVLANMASKLRAIRTPSEQEEIRIRFGLRSQETPMPAVGQQAEAEARLAGMEKLFTQ